jgi:excisionase family DNA binding protein
MEVITVESECFKMMLFNIEQTRKMVERLTEELKKAKGDYWMTPDQVAEYTGFKYTWIYERRNDIGCFREGKGLRFKKSNVEKYMEENSFKK